MLELTPFQQELWARTKSVLDDRYAANRVTPAPMPEQALDELRVPYTLDKAKSGPIPWDMRLLLAYDRNFRLWGSSADRPLFAPYLSGQKNIYHPELEMEIHRDVIALMAEYNPLFSQPAQGPADLIHQTVSKHGDLPTAMEMAQIGGNEIPMLWFAEQANGCTPVLHSGYLRNACLLDYVAQVMMQVDVPENHAGADIPFLVPTLLYEESLRELEPKLDPLRKVLAEMMGAYMEMLG